MPLTIRLVLAGGLALAGVHARPLEAQHDTALTDVATMLRDAVLTCKLGAECGDGLRWRRRVLAGRDTAGMRAMSYDHGWRASLGDWRSLVEEPRSPLERQVYRRSPQAAEDRRRAQERITADSTLLRTRWLISVDLQHRPLSAYDYDVGRGSLRVWFRKDGQTIPRDENVPWYRITGVQLPGFTGVVVRDDPGRVIGRERWIELFARIPMADTVALSLIDASERPGPTLEYPDGFEVPTGGVVPVLLYRLADIRVAGRDLPGPYFRARCAYLVLVDVHEVQARLVQRLVGGTGPDAAACPAEGPLAH